MGIIRKTMSVGTLGLIDFRSGKEAARRAAAKESKANAKLAKAQTKVAKSQMTTAPGSEAQPVPAPAPGWYAVPGGLSYWDGQQWSSFTPRQ